MSRNTPLENIRESLGTNGQMAVSVASPDYVRVSVNRAKMVSGTKRVDALFEGPMEKNSIPRVGDTLIFPGGGEFVVTSLLRSYKQSGELQHIFIEELTTG